MGKLIRGEQYFDDQKTGWETITVKDTGGGQYYHNGINFQNGIISGGGIITGYSSDSNTIKALAAIALGLDESEALEFFGMWQYRIAPNTPPESQYREMIRLAYEIKERRANRG